jgi:NDP-sugar pyrophosphorylase family protein
MSRYVGAVLAGGLGSRLRPLGASLPKALVPVANRPLIAHHLETLRAVGIESVLVVVGHAGSRIAEAMGDGSAHGVGIQYVEQGEPLGSAHALNRLARFVTGPLLVVLGDYYFAAPSLGRMITVADDGARSVVAAKREPNRAALIEACTLETDDDGRVLRVVEKPRAPRTDLKGCGIYVLQPEFFDAVARTPRTVLRDEYELSTALDLHVAAGHALVAEEVIEEDVNVTRPLDVLRSNVIWLRRAGRRQLIGAGAKIPDETILDEAVVGDNAEVEQPTVLRRVVVFEGARVDGGQSFEDVLVTHNGVIDCRPPKTETPEEGSL